MPIMLLPFFPLTTVIMGMFVITSVKFNKFECVDLVKDTLDLEKQVTKPVRDLLTFTCLSVLFHYFEEPDPSLPASSLELGVFLGQRLKELAAERFVEDYKTD